MIAAYIDVLVSKNRDITIVVRSNSSLYKAYKGTSSVRCVVLKSRTAIGLLLEGKKRLTKYRDDNLFAVNAYHAIYAKLVGLKSRIILNHWLVRKGLVARVLQFYAAHISDEFIFEYDGQKNDVYGRFYNSTKSTVVNTPINGIRFKSRNGLVSPKNGLFMSAISYRKGIHRFLLRNSAFIKSRGLNIRIAGAPVNRKQWVYTLALKATIIILGLKRNVTFLGWQSQVGAVLDEADFFLITSYSEGLSGSLRKAIINGLPVYATNVGGNASLISDGTNGLVDDGLIKFEDFYCLIGEYYKNTERCSASVSQNYSIERFHELISTVI